MLFWHIWPFYVMRIGSGYSKSNTDTEFESDSNTETEPDTKIEYSVLGYLNPLLKPILTPSTRIRFWYSVLITSVRI